MGRKRLLGLLAAMSATMVLQAAPAAAQISLPGVGEVDLSQSDDEDCLKVGVDLSLADALKLDADACVLDEDGDLLDVDAKLEVGDTEVDVGKKTEPVTDAVNDVADRSSGSDDAPSEEPSSSPPPRSSSSSSSSGSGDEEAEDVVVAGGAADFAAAQPRHDQEALLAELRDGLAAQRRADVAFGPLAPGVGVPGTALAPEVAEGGTDVAPGVSPAEPAAPEIVAPSPQREDAILASGPVPVGDQVPAALQLLTGAMVLGAATVWFLARREYGGPAPTAS